MMNIKRKGIYLIKMDKLDINDRVQLIIETDDVKQDLGSIGTVVNVDGKPGIVTVAFYECEQDCKRKYLKKVDKKKTFTY